MPVTIYYVECINNVAFNDEEWNKEWLRAHHEEFASSTFSSFSLMSCRCLSVCLLCLSCLSLFPNVKSFQYARWSQLYGYGLRLRKKTSCTLWKWFHLSFFSNTFWLLDFLTLWIYWKCLDHTRTTLESSSWNSLMLIMSVQSRLYSKVTAMNKASALWIIGCGSKSDSCGIPYNVTPCWGSTCCCLVVNALNDLHRYSF